MGREKRPPGLGGVPTVGGGDPPGSRRVQRDLRKIWVMVSGHAKASERDWSRSGHYHEIVCTCGDVVLVGPEATPIAAKTLASALWWEHLNPSQDS